MPFGKRLVAGNSPTFEYNIQCEQQRIIKIITMGWYQTQRHRFQRQQLHKRYLFVYDDNSQNTMMII